MSTSSCSLCVSVGLVCGSCLWVGMEGMEADLQGPAQARQGQSLYLGWGNLVSTGRIQ